MIESILILLAIILFGFFITVPIYINVLKELLWIELEDKINKIINNRKKGK